MRHLHAVHRRLSHRRDCRRLRAGRDALHLVSHDRAERARFRKRSARRSAGTCSAATSARTCALTTSRRSRRSIRRGSRAAGRERAGCRSALAAVGPGAARLRSGIGDGARPPRHASAETWPSSSAIGDDPRASDALDHPGGGVRNAAPSAETPLVREHVAWARQRRQSGRRGRVASPRRVSWACLLWLLWIRSENAVPRPGCGAGASGLDAADARSELRALGRAAGGVRHTWRVRARRQPPDDRTSARGDQARTADGDSEGRAPVSGRARSNRTARGC